MPPNPDEPESPVAGDAPRGDEAAFTIAAARSDEPESGKPAAETMPGPGETPSADTPPSDADTPSADTPPASGGASGSGSPPRGGSTGSGGSRSDRPRPPKPPGLGEQLSATFNALARMTRAHVALARAEADEIKGEVGRAAGLGGAAIALLILLAFLLPIGLILFTGEWIFGSIGWGVLLGSELLVAVAVVLVLVALRVPRLGIDFVLAFVIALVVAVILGLGLPHTLWTTIGDAIDIGDPAWRPLAVSVVVMAVLGALIGAIAGARARQEGSIIDGLVAGFAAGAWLGALLAISYTWRTGTAMGVAVGLAAWILLMGARVGREGIDAEALKTRFMPQATIDTTKETIEWAKSKVPFGPKS